MDYACLFVFPGFLIWPFWFFPIFFLLWMQSNIQNWSMNWHNLWYLRSFYLVINLLLPLLLCTMTKDIWHCDFSPPDFFNSQNMFIVLDPLFEKLLFVEYTICVSFFRNSGKRFARVYIRGIKKKEVPRNSHHDSDNCPPTETKTEQKKNKKRTVKTTEHRGRFLELS